MDNRRWNTLQVLDGGILDLPAPKTSRPEGVELADVNEEDLSAETLRTGLESGGLSASMYYGCWSVWKADEGFDGELLQYRSVTDSFKGLSIDDAVERAQEWGYQCYG